MSNEAFARVHIDQVLKDAGRAMTDGTSVHFEYPLKEAGKADYVLFDRQGRALAARCQTGKAGPLAVLEA